MIGDLSHLVDFGRDSVIFWVRKIPVNALNIFQEVLEGIHETFVCRAC